MRIATFDHLAFVLLLLGGAALAGKGWLDAHPESNPWAPLDLSDAEGWATEQKLAALRSDGTQCRAVLERSGIAFEDLGATGEGSCARSERITLGDAPLSPTRPPTSCAVAAGLERWLERTVEPAAQEMLGSPLARIEHLGAHSCRRLYGRASGAWSQHATGNAIDVAAFVLADGRRISVLLDWEGDREKAAFLHRVRDGACEPFGTVLSPDYNAAHRDHLHLDQHARGWGGVCR